jgi:hypothetical protein
LGPDGKRLVFRRREPATVLQIYTLDLSSGDVKRISPGLGKRPARFPSRQRRILFASTHHDRSRSSIRMRSWRFARERAATRDYDPEMDIYAYSERPAVSSG